jgi:hypothetical protein
MIYFLDFFTNNHVLKLDLGVFQDLSANKLTVVCDLFITVVICDLFITVVILKAIYALPNLLPLKIKVILNL